MSKHIPDRKVLSAGIAGVLAWAMVLLAPWLGVQLTIETALPLIVALMSGVAYLVPPSAKDVLKRIDEEIMAMGELMPARPASAPQPSAGPGASGSPAS